MKGFLISAIVASISVAAPVLADEVTDTLDAARSAYDDGQIGRTLEELSFAQSLLQEMRSQMLTEHLPKAPEGWTREVSSDIGGAMAFAGGGMAASADYMKDGESFTVSIMADSPMISAMGPMLSNPTMARAAGAKVERLGDMKILNMDDSLAALVDNRILVQIDGAAPETMMPVMEQMDFDALADFIAG